MEYDAFSSTNTQHLVSCGNCGRNFNPEALQRHVPICAKSTQKKRKVFDMTKQRSEGTELQQFKKSGRFRGGGGARQPQQREPAPKKNNWRQKHEDFINAIRSAKGVTKALETGGPLPPPPPPSINPDYVQCPHCERRFNETAAERHINFCREQHDRLPNKKQPTAAAQQRAAARTQYKVPRPKAKNVTSPPSSGYGGGGGYSYGANTPTRSGGSTSTGRSGGTPGNTRYAGAGNNRSTDQQSGPPSGRALRTGRTAETYSEARQLSAKQRSGMSTKSDFHDNNHPRYGGYGSSTHTGPTRGGAPTGMRNGDHGYHSGDSDNINSLKAARGGSGMARFCHDCGNKYPTTTAKFCCECGIRRVNLT